MGELDGKVMLVAGSSRGIGKVMAQVYAREGAKVAVVARTDQPGKIPGTINETAEAIRADGGVALPVRCDTTDEDQVRAMVEQVEAELGPIDVMVNSTAVIFYKNLIDTPLKRWDLIYRVNVRGAFILSQAVLPGMIERRGGNIIHLTSAASTLARSGTIAYGSTKAAVERLSRGLAAEVKEYGIAVNALEPGRMRTEGALFGRGPDADWDGWVDPWKIEPVALYLAQQTADTLTGAVVSREKFDAARA